MVIMVVEWSERASMRLGEIFEYLEKEASKRTARKIVNQIYSCADIPIKNPLAGPREESLTNRDREFRYLVQGNYKIIYQVDLERVVVSTVFDCRQDPERIGSEVK